MRNVALDLAVRKVAYCEVLDGAVIRRCTALSIEELRDELGPETQPAVVAIEACREAWSVCKKLEAWGHKPLLVDTTRVKALGVGAHRRKTDRIDAEVLARAVERGGIPLAHRLSEPRQQLRLQLGVRAQVVGARAETITTIRGILRARGVTAPSCAADDFLAMLHKESLDESTRTLIEPLRTCLVAVDEQVRLLDDDLRQRSMQDEEVVRLATAPGVGPVVAASFISVIDNPERFANAHQVEAYLGLVPSEDSSGDRRRLGSITKNGNRYLRSVLVQAGWCVLRSKQRADPLTHWGAQIAKRRGNRIAAIAVARRLAGVLWAMWKKKNTYDPAHVAQASARGLEDLARRTQVQAEAMKRAARKIRGRAKRSTITPTNLQEDHRTNARC